MVLIWDGIHCLTNSFAARRVRIGVDYGPRYIGIAYSDYFGVVHPYTTVRNTGDLSQISESIVRFVKILRASEIVLGVPLDGDGSLDYNVQNMNGKISLNFSVVLSCIVHHLCSQSVNVVLFDERYSTQEAKLRKSKGNVMNFLKCGFYCNHRYFSIASLDSVAAACILERYLEEKGVGSLVAQTCSYPPPAEIASFNYDVIRKYVRMRSNVQDYHDWHEVKSYVENYKVSFHLSSYFSSSCVLTRLSCLQVYDFSSNASSTLMLSTNDSTPLDTSLSNNNDDNDNDDDCDISADDDEETKQQREILLQRRPKGFSKAAWKLRLLNGCVQKPFQ